MKNIENNFIYCVGFILICVIKFIEKKNVFYLVVFNVFIGEFI